MLTSVGILEGARKTLREQILGELIDSKNGLSGACVHSSCNCTLDQGRAAYRELLRRFGPPRLFEVPLIVIIEEMSRIPSIEHRDAFRARIADFLDSCPLPRIHGP